MALFSRLSGPGQCVGLQTGVGEPVLGTPIADSDVDLDRLEQRLITQPMARIIGMGVNVTDHGPAGATSRPDSPARPHTVIRDQPVLNGLQRPGDPVLLRPWS